MAEHGPALPVWGGPDGFGPVSEAELVALGVSPELVERLSEWNAEYQSEALDIWPNDPAAEVGWVRRGLTLSFDLQHEVPDLNVFYSESDRDTPVAELRGPG